jgi:protein required for attachment to host cells
MMSKAVMKPRRKGRLVQIPDVEARRKKTLVVVADGSRARFLESSDDRRRLVASRQGEMTAAEARRPSRDLASDKPGRGFSSAGGGIRHAYEEKHDIKKVAKHNFTARVAVVLDKVCAGDRYDRVVLVAPPRSLGELHKLLSKRVRKAVSHEIAKDFTSSTPTALRKALVGLLPASATA